MTQSKPEFHTGTVVMLAMCVVSCGLIVAIVFPVIQGDGVAYTATTPLAAAEPEKDRFEEFESNPFEYASSSKDAAIVDATLTEPWPADRGSAQRRGNRFDSQRDSDRMLADNTRPRHEPVDRPFERRDNSSWKTEPRSQAEFAFDPDQAVARSEQAVDSGITFHTNTETTLQSADDFSEPSGEAAVAEIADMMTTATSPQLVASQMPTGSVYAPITVHPVTVHLDGLMQDQLAIIQQKFDESLMRQQAQIEQIAALHSVDKKKQSEDRKTKRMARNQQRQQDDEQRLKMAEISSGFRRLEKTVISLEQKTQERLAEISDAANRSEIAAQTIRDYQRALDEQETRIAALPKPQPQPDDFSGFSMQQKEALPPEQDFIPVPTPEQFQPGNHEAAKPDIFEDFSAQSITIPEHGQEPDSVTDVTISAATSETNEAQVQSQIDVLPGALVAAPEQLMPESQAKEVLTPTPIQQARRTTPSQIYIAPRGQSGRFYPAVPAVDRPMNPPRMTPTRETLKPVKPETPEVEVRPRDVGFQKTFEFPMDVEDLDSTSSIDTPTSIGIGNIQDSYRFQVSAPLTSPGSRTTDAERIAAISRPATDLELDFATIPANGIQLVSAQTVDPRPLAAMAIQQDTTAAPETNVPKPVTPPQKTLFKGGRGNNRHVQRNRSGSLIPNLRLPSFPIFKSKADASPTRPANRAVAKREQSDAGSPIILQTAGRRTEMTVDSASTARVGAGRSIPTEIYQPTWNPPPQDPRGTAQTSSESSKSQKPSFLSRIAGAFRRIGR